MTSLPPAGWYHDPDRPGLLRWWNGQSWTHHTQAAPAPAAPPTAPPPAAAPQPTPTPPAPQPAPAPQPSPPPMAAPPPTAAPPAAWPSGPAPQAATATPATPGAGLLSTQGARMLAVAAGLLLAAPAVLVLGVRIELSDLGGLIDLPGDWWDATADALFLLPWLTDIGDALDIGTDAALSHLASLLRPWAAIAGIVGVVLSRRRDGTGLRRTAATVTAGLAGLAALVELPATFTRYLDQIGDTPVLSLAAVVAFVVLPAIAAGLAAAARTR